MATIFDYWQAIVGLIAVFGVWLAWRQTRGQAPTTTNSVEGSTNVTQKGGAGVTENTAKNSSDVDQSGA